MLFNLVLLAIALADPRAAADSVRLPCRAAEPVDSMSVCAIAPTDTGRRRPRPRAIEYSDWYARRLQIHRIGSYTMLPLFGVEYVLGQQLLNGTDPHSATGSAHALAAGGIGVLFTVNTVTGLWNLWDARSDPAGRTRRILHSLAMLAGDAGFVWTGATGGAAKRSNDAARRHRNIALGSIGISTLGTAMMWLWKN